MKKQLTALLILSFLAGFSAMAQEQDLAKVLEMAAKKEVNTDTTKIWDIIIEEETDTRTALAKALDTMRVSINLPSFLTASQNKYFDYPVPGAKPSLDQEYGNEPLSGDTALNLYLGTQHSLIKHRNEDYVLFVSAIGEVHVLLGDMFDPIEQAFNVINPTFNRIKYDLRYGIPYKSATAEEIAILDTMITHYPEGKAQELFNADYMVSYPMNLRGEVYEGKYSQCKAVAVSKNKMDIFFYFMMTDETAENFDSYLQGLKRVFWYNE
jgi:hypothetical protein